jgi:hypothetical protein
LTPASGCPPAAACHPASSPQSAACNTPAPCTQYTSTQYTSSFLQSLCRPALMTPTHCPELHMLARLDCHDQSTCNSICCCCPTFRPVNSPHSRAHNLECVLVLCCIQVQAG